MPIDDLTALGQKMREARKNKDLTQQELSDLSHVSVKQIANIEKGKMNPSYLILRALAKILHISLDIVEVTAFCHYTHLCNGVFMFFYYSKTQQAHRLSLLDYYPGRSQQPDLWLIAPLVLLRTE